MKRFQMSDELRLINLAQVSFYIRSGVQPIRLEYTDRLVFIFSRMATQELYDRWCKYDTDIKRK